MRRRDLLALPAAALPVRGAGRRVNILFILNDDQRRDTIAALGNRHIRTPHLDGLVRSGVSFRNAYCMGGFSAAVCLPSRMMIQRGVSWFTAQKQTEPRPAMAQTFRDAGYETFHLGKRGNVDLKANQLYEHNHYLTPDDNTERLAGRPGQQSAGRVTAFLKTRDRSRPFFVYLADSGPHDPRVAPPEYLARYDAARLPLPPNYRPFHPFDNGELLIRDEKLAPWPRTEAEIRSQLRDYYATITHMDEQLGRILEALRETGEYANTVIVFSADQGIALGSHGLMGKQNLYEHSMNAPLLFAGPGIPKGRSVEGFAYLFDIYPTLCEFAGIAPPAELEGRSQARVIRGQVRQVRDTVFLAYKDLQRAVRRGRYKLIRYPRIDRTQLFDLSSDPDELRDLSGGPGQRKRVLELLSALRDEQSRYGDTAPLAVADPRRGDVDEAWFRARAAE